MNTHNPTENYCKIYNNEEKKYNNIIIPLPKKNYFYIYDKKEKFIEVKFLSQSEIAADWEQKLPKYRNKHLIQTITIPISYLPSKYWHLLKKHNTNIHKIINNGLLKYSIIETTQDNILFDLYNELSKYNYSTTIIESYINLLDSQHLKSWLVIKAKYLLSLY